jgi:hypothetical protein
LQCTGNCGKFAHNSHARDRARDPPATERKTIEFLLPFVSLFWHDIRIFYGILTTIYIAIPPENERTQDISLVSGVRRTGLWDCSQSFLRSIHRRCGSSLLFCSPQLAGQPAFGLSAGCQGQCVGPARALRAPSPSLGSSSLPFCLSLPVCLPASSWLTADSLSLPIHPSTPLLPPPSSHLPSIGASAQHL